MYRSAPQASRGRVLDTRACVAREPAATYTAARAAAAPTATASPLATLRAAVDALAAEDPSALGDADMMAEITALRREADRLEAQCCDASVRRIIERRGAQTGR